MASMFLIYRHETPKHGYSAVITTSTKSRSYISFTYKLIWPDGFVKGVFGKLFKTILFIVDCYKKVCLESNVVMLWFLFALVVLF